MNLPMQAARVWRLLPTRRGLTLAINANLYPLMLLSLTCVGFALRLGLLSAFPLREDEAIYGFWARAAITDPFFLHTWPDKPPLFIWLLSGAFALLGPSAETARLVSIFASTLTIPLVALGAQCIWGSRTAAFLAAMLLTFNPFAVSFAPTVYIDSLLVLLGTGAIVCALSGRGLGAGLLLGAACMTKQQGVFYAPLVIALLCTRIKTCHPIGVSLPAHPEKLLRGDRAKALGWALLGVALIIVPVLWWDSQRWAVAPSPWELAQRTYAPLTWLPPSQWLMRGDAWAEWLWYLANNWAVWTMVDTAVVIAFGMVLHRPRSALPLALLLAWGIAFVLLHLITTVQIWDRYLLPLAPWLAVVASGPLALVKRSRLPEWARGALLLLLIVGVAGLLHPAIAAARGQLPIGGDHGDYAGLTEAIAWVKDQGVCNSPHPSPPQVGDGTVLGRGSSAGFQNCSPNRPAILYHQVLGWHFRFYLFDEVQPKGDEPSRFDLRWFPSAAYLADNAAKSPYPPKYLIIPDWATPRDLALHLALRGLTLEQRLQVDRFAVMEIVQPPRPFCEWCKSSILPTAPQMSVLPVPTPP